MREVIVVCRSSKKARDRAARTLDRYFWRIGDRTWRGKATNACLDRVARELRREAARNTAIAVHEIRSARESRTPLFRIGSKSRFSDEGLAPVTSHPTAVSRSSARPLAERSALAAARIAALFHDLGKATVLFQEKLRRALKGKAIESDAIRHELVSAIVWDELFGRLCDANLVSALGRLEADAIDAAWSSAIPKLLDLHREPDALLPLDFTTCELSITSHVGFLILTHHRLPQGDSDHQGLLARRHVNAAASLDAAMLAIAPGAPFWREEWWLTCLRRSAAQLAPDAPSASVDMALRASLMFADHLGSAAKKPSDPPPAHLANTIEDPPHSKRWRPADSLSNHVRRVYAQLRGAFDLLHRLRDRFPALDAEQMPEDVANPSHSANPFFHWQTDAAKAARRMCGQREGGFFACLMAGTGTGKTRAAPTILANAALADVVPQRRYFRMTLALGLRVLASQSAKEYVNDLGFRNEDVALLIGQPPIAFDDASKAVADGSESVIETPEWLRVEAAEGGAPVEGDPREEAWLRALSFDTERNLPAHVDLILEKAGKRAEMGKRLIAPPVLVATVDHLMGIAAPVNARFLLQTLRQTNADLVLDEIDQFDGEDIAAIARLVYQTAAAGRRVVLMSATLPQDVATALFHAYETGWRAFASATGLSPHVNALVTGDAAGSCMTNEDAKTIEALFATTRGAILAQARKSTPLRRGEIGWAYVGWDDLVQEIDAGCARLHAANKSDLAGYGVSIGVVRMTRIAHAAALATQLPKGAVRDRLRVVLCLHANFPRLLRAWIEDRLARALTRKGRDPDAGLRALCAECDLFERARAIGARAIEIVVVASPVIETGNDLDFDYAVIDPISTRAVVQTAGRVRRHRPPRAGDDANVLILGRSPIAIVKGFLAAPGVEAKPDPDTGVTRIRLDAFEDRRFLELAGDDDFRVIDAASTSGPLDKAPLRKAETNLRICMIDSTPKSPLGRYLDSSITRMNSKMTETRRFRRTATRDILYLMEGERPETGEWLLDLAPGTRESALMPAQERGLDPGPSPELEGLLFRDLAAKAWSAWATGRPETDRADLRRLMQVSIPDYGQDLTPAMCYQEFTGFTRGRAEDLRNPFGKTTKSQ